MGAVKFDLVSQETFYKDFSFSTIEDIYDLLWKLDVVFDGAEKGNVESIALKIDFLDLVKKCDSDVLDEYINIQIGVSPLKIEDRNSNIIEIISERLDIPIENCEEQFIKAINYIKKNNKGKWTKWYRFNYKDQKVGNKKEIPKIKPAFNGMEDLDYKIKYLFKPNVLAQLDYPEELNDLIDYRQQNQIRLDDLEKKSNLSSEEHEEKKWRIKNKIKIDQDISEMKRSHDIEVIKTNKIGRTEDKVSFDEEIDYINNDNYIRVVDDCVSFYKILDIAENCLTNKQFTIFNLYFINNFNQSEIAEIIDDTQGNISRDLNNIINKIKNNI